MKTVANIRPVDLNRLNKAYNLLQLAYHYYRNESKDITLQIEGNGTVGGNIGAALASLDTIFQEFDLIKDRQ